MRAFPESLSDEERFNRLRLIRSENVGPVTFRQLMQRFSSAQEALDALPSLARRGGRRSIRIATTEDIENELNSLGKAGGKLIFDGERSYPEALSAIEDAPPAISIFGRRELLKKPCIGIVGGRNASIHGRAMASDMAAALGKEGYLIASGMARGIDASAHNGSISTGSAAVLAGGVDNIYPVENTDLYRQLTSDGLVISEMPLGMIPKAQHFPRRNRIISGLSLGIVVIEARRKSGSLITARYAADQGREVFAVPGFPQDPRAQGGNDLIKCGAALVQSAKDVLSEITTNTLREPLVPAPDFDGREHTDIELDDIRSQVRDGLNAVPLPIDTLLRTVEAPAGTIQLVLLELELAGLVQRHPGGRFSLSV